MSLNGTACTAPAFLTSNNTHQKIRTFISDKSTRKFGHCAHQSYAFYRQSLLTQWNLFLNVFISFRIDGNIVNTVELCHKSTEKMQPTLFLLMTTKNIFDKEVKYCEACDMIGAGFTSIWILIIYFLQLPFSAFNCPIVALWVRRISGFGNRIADMKYNAIRLIRRRRWLCLNRMVHTAHCAHEVRVWVCVSALCRWSCVYRMRIRKTNCHIFIITMETIWW